ncbi:unnamed protein product [Kuraishia capsulata CBS 1993]|uniref:Mitochondrial acidic protein MAM33 n=1 Tax=Kuraishia capsulata CBS 1993 TaxID=1382522 RepID=W6MJD3_9ASCO|nr:uncharacterized protein KUCA_T00002348001 [Kuraishia capsulata CBS 1993]CDK26376.1 unnamed protein product [Kuraishia capsulata CBS 1993]
MSVARLAIRSIRGSNPLLLRASAHAAFRPVRFFNASAIKLNKQTSELKSILSKELEYEENDSFGLESHHEAWLANSGFQVSNTDGKILAELTKTTSEEVIHVYFDVQQVTNNAFATRDEALSEDLDQDGLNEEDVDDYLDEAFASVNVVIEKVADRSAVGFDMALSIKNSQFSVNGITNFDSVDLALAETAEAETQRQLKYTGPLFENLAEELQESIQSYLVSRGLDEELADFVVAYSAYKENQEYVNWLGKLEGFFK